MHCSRKEMATIVGPMRLEWMQGIFLKLLTEIIIIEVTQTYQVCMEEIWDESGLLASKFGDFLSRDPTEDIEEDTGNNPSNQQHHRTTSNCATPVQLGQNSLVDHSFSMCMGTTFRDCDFINKMNANLQNGM
ncbi:hypothetical protein O181_076127 [Austropuccinia psidii MF-1]|uniref:Uncharacterized protein n=1 Tax=Austropuccinia psidii MF-1 TaxID=1389203 RepID=A0A9Q3IDI0_9BASI|nr:hypothetical protein [Austropuccinia psidii MF-1]